MTSIRRTEVEVRTLRRDDADAIRRFFARIPEGDRTFFREDVFEPGVIERWLADPRQHRLVAIVDGDICGHVAVIRESGWSRHVGELRLVIDPAHRRRGLGRLLAQRAVVDAVDMGITKLVVAVVAAQEATVTMFTKLGFGTEGLLKGHVRRQSGELLDLLLLARAVEPLLPAIRREEREGVAVGRDGA